jgi:hypothetical protein
MPSELVIIKTSISSLINYLDENRLMEFIPDPVWKHILAIEEAVEHHNNEKENIEGLLTDVEDTTDTSYKAGYQQAVLNVLNLLGYSGK